jgi:hypothetical protein
MEPLARLGGEPGVLARGDDATLAAVEAAEDPRLEQREE